MGRIWKTDVVIIQNSPLLVSFSAMLLFKGIFKRKVVLNVSDIWPLSGLQLGAITKGRIYNIMDKIANYNYRHADIIVGQSNEILSFINNIVAKPQFLYRNLPKINTSIESKDQKYPTFRVVYAGLLGVAQGVLHLIQQVDFQKLGIDFDIYGKGNEEQEIIAFINKNPNCRVHYKGHLSNDELNKTITRYHASIVPLQSRIIGAVPSKIFELMHFQIPILFCGGGEGAEIVKEFSVGLISEPGDYQQLYYNLSLIKNISSTEYEKFVENCSVASQKAFSFDHQFKSFLTKITE